MHFIIATFGFAARPYENTQQTESAVGVFPRPAQPTRQTQHWQIQIEKETSQNEKYLAGCGTTLTVSFPPPESFLSPPLLAELWYAPLPAPLSRFARHYWLVVRDGSDTETVTRWEVWQTQSAGGESIGHVHKNLMRPDSGVGGGAAVNVFTWRGTDAENIVRVLRRAWTHYPHRSVYRAFPGPNSNTFVAWVLKRAGLQADAALLLGWQAIGRGWWL